MKIYWKMWAQTLNRRSEMPITLTDKEFFTEAVLAVLGIFVMVVGVGLVFTHVRWGIPVYSIGLASVVTGLHIETVARVRDLTHVCDEECQ